MLHSQYTIYSLACQQWVLLGDLQGINVPFPRHEKRSRRRSVALHLRWRCILPVPPANRFIVSRQKASESKNIGEREKVGAHLVEDGDGSIGIPKIYSDDSPLQRRWRWYFYGCLRASVGDLSSVQRHLFFDRFSSFFVGGGGIGRVCERGFIRLPVCVVKSKNVINGGCRVACSFHLSMI